MSFAYSQKPLKKVVENKFLGEWKYLHKALFEIPDERAKKACLELALFLRMLDDDEDITGYQEDSKSSPNCGKLVLKNGTDKNLTFREVANKVIHSSRIEWDFMTSEEPIFICYTRDEEKWVRAEVNIIAIAAVCSQLMS
jgi:molybdate-binding protein